MLKSEEQFRRPLHLQLHTARTEDLVRRTDIEFHIGDVEFLFVVVLHLADFLLPIGVHQFLLRVGLVFGIGHQIRRCHIHITYFGMNNIIPCIRLIINGCGDISRSIQVETALGGR